MITAVLHDVIEDTPYKLDELRVLGYSTVVVDALDCLTRREDPRECYAAFIERAALNPLAARVKVADLEDNMDVRRIAEPQDEDMKRLRRYRRSWARLAGR